MYSFQFPFDNKKCPQRDLPEAHVNDGLVPSCIGIHIYKPSCCNTPSAEDIGEQGQREGARSVGGSTQPSPVQGNNYNSVNPQKATSFHSLGFCKLKHSLSKIKTPPPPRSGIYPPGALALCVVRAVRNTPLAPSQRYVGTRCARALRTTARPAAARTPRRALRR